jgi:hypothetical protein
VQGAHGRRVAVRGVVGDRAGLVLPGSGHRADGSDCDTTGNSEILRTGKPITLSVDCFDADGDTVTLTHSTPAHGTLSARSSSRQQAAWLGA